VSGEWVRRVVKESIVPSESCYTRLWHAFVVQDDLDIVVSASSSRNRSY